LNLFKRFLEPCQGVPRRLFVLDEGVGSAEANVGVEGEKVDHLDVFEANQSLSREEEYARVLPRVGGKSRQERVGE
jgi:hypothetical protein